MTPEEFLDGLPEPRRAEVAQLDTVIRAAVPELARTVHSAMLGYGLPRGARQGKAGACSQIGHKATEPRQ